MEQHINDIAEKLVDVLVEERLTKSQRRQLGFVLKDIIELPPEKKVSFEGLAAILKRVGEFLRARL